MGVIPFKGGKQAPKALQSQMETRIISVAEASAWKLPPFQRPLRVNPKVRAVAERLVKTQTIEGVITLGKLAKDPSTYIVDGQHRIEAFKLSTIPEAIVDLRIVQFETLGEMSEEFVRLNSSLVRMRPDDLLRGMESAVPALGIIRKNCEFVDYDHVRRNSAGPVLGMSSVIRCWAGSFGETPASSSAGQSVASLAENLDATNVQNLVTFLLTAHAAWGRDPEYYRLWGNLNLIICMWLWRKLVLDRDRVGNKRYAVLDIATFKQCLMSVSADGDYLQWLPGRNLTDRDRSPCFGRLKTIFARRLADGTSDKKKVLLPSPAWASK
jgi:hypothetical protein